MNDREVFGLKAKLTGDFGEEFEKMQEVAEAEANQLKGGADALRQQIAKFSTIYDQIDAERDGKGGDKTGAQFPTAASTPLEIAAYAKKQVMLCEEAMRNFALQLQNRSLASKGKSAALKQSMQLMQRHHDTSSSHVKNLELALEVEAEVEKRLAIERGEAEPDEETQRRSLRRETNGHPGPRPSQARADAGGGDQEPETPPESPTEPAESPEAPETPSEPPEPPDEPLAAAESPSEPETEATTRRKRRRKARKAVEESPGE